MCCPWTEETRDSKFWISPVSQPVSHHPMEHKDSVTLTCVTSSTTETILWFKDNQIFPSNDRISLSQDNRTLTIFRVSSTDSGSYQCEVMNPVSRNTSDPYTLTVNPSPAGGPDTSLQTAVGAAIGSVLGAAVLITSAVLLYKRGSNCWTGKYGVTEEYEVPKVSSTPPALNQNITQQNLGGTYVNTLNPRAPAPAYTVNTLNPRAPAPAYTDLVFRNQSVYNDLKR
ncbi:carcinoembryonic antigen-related cell adhesion molecule 1 isoform X1 [Microcaecilia unicolor]|uniref:Carcinoembryonic antigen-related cell adhesion molecule 1-like isoform X1 n=1 Tax=Microcaecilia unicolor TaxID=1415580 RepID=A0A6P7YQS3_9AMPH|nr:carcinoembryonic antigen-related cell adhesion molecule 1-like isoform X1 [Microcaecilia unicolor]